MREPDRTKDLSGPRFRSIAGRLFLPPAISFRPACGVIGRKFGRLNLAGGFFFEFRQNKLAPPSPGSAGLCRLRTSLRLKLRSSIRATPRFSTSQSSPDSGTRCPCDAVTPPPPTIKDGVKPMPANQAAPGAVCRQVAPARIAGRCRAGSRRPNRPASIDDCWPWGHEWQCCNGAVSPFTSRPVMYATHRLPASSRQCDRPFLTAAAVSCFVDDAVSVCLGEEIIAIEPAKPSAEVSGT